MGGLMEHLTAQECGPAWFWYLLAPFAGAGLTLSAVGLLRVLAGTRGRRGRA